MIHVVIHPIYALQRDRGDGGFDPSLLPLDLNCDVSMENVASMFADDTFAPRPRWLSEEDMSRLREVKYGLVRRSDDSKLSYSGPEEAQTHEPVEVLMALLRLIRPMRERVGLMRGHIRTDGTIEIKSFGHPYNLIEVPEVEKLYALRSSDALMLRSLANEMLRVMTGDFWKIRMAVQFYQAGFFEQLQWKNRFFMRCAAIEAIYSTRNNQGSAASISRIINFLGGESKIYEKGDIPSCLPQSPEITVETIAKEVYRIRNYIAHGDRIPNDLFQTTLRDGVNGRVSLIAVVDEAAGVIARRTVLKILEERLADHFFDRSSAHAYFESNGC